MDKLKLLGIAPYPGMKELMQNIAEQRDDVELVVFEGDLEKGLEIAVQHQKEGFSGILSRGETATIIREKVGIPVFEITISVYDILSAIRLAQGYNDRFAVVGFPNYTKRVRTLCELLRYEVTIVTLKDSKEVIPCLKNLKKTGYSLILGGMSVATLAKRMGISSILIISGRESIESAIDHALELETVRKKDRQMISFLNALLNSRKERIVAFRDNGETVCAFPGSSLVENIPDDVLAFMKKMIASVLDGVKCRKVMKRKNGEHLILEGEHFLTQGESCFAFAASEFSPSPSFEDTRGVVYFNREDLLKNVDTVFSNSNFISKVTETINKFSRTDIPVLITGEPSVGKDKTAMALYVNSRWNDNPLVFVNCEVITARKWNHLLSGPDSPLSDRGLTVYFRNIDSLDANQSKTLIRRLQESSALKNNRLIFSCQTRPDFPEEHPFFVFLQREIAFLSIRLPPLRERVDDLPNLCSLYISEINIASGKQIVGLTAEALALMQKFDWEYNLRQLKRVLTRVIVLNEGPYIEIEAISEALKMEGNSRINVQNLDLSGSLEKITSNIVHVVLREEKMNQSKTARRLGISRSTLWRIMHGASKS
ncbi:MAG: PrpR N-terminal domain-containing protein [Synergistaceae bacterium]|nr:PrpR N-terminal domain-containing protein [Synergistaceae bacterium]